VTRFIKRNDLIQSQGNKRPVSEFIETKSRGKMAERQQFTAKVSSEDNSKRRMISLFCNTSSTGKLTRVELKYTMKHFVI
jgi:hypothetical protein